MKDRTLERLHLAIEYLDWNIGGMSIYVVHLPDFGTSREDNECTVWFGEEDNYTTYDTESGEILSTTMNHDSVEDLLLDLHEQIDEHLVMIKHGKYLMDVNS